MVIYFLYCIIPYGSIVHCKIVREINFFQATDVCFSIAYIVQAQPRCRRRRRYGGRHDELSFAGLEVWQGVVGWVDRAPEVHVLGT